MEKIIKKVLDKQVQKCYNKYIIKQKEVTIMANKIRLTIQTLEAKRAKYGLTKREQEFLNALRKITG